MAKYYCRSFRINLAASFSFFAALFIFTFYNLWLEDIIVKFNTNKYSQTNINPFAIHEKNSKDLKKILYYTPFFSRRDYSFGYGTKPFSKNHCAFTNCITTNNRHLLESISEYDAIIFHARDLDVQDLPDQSLRNPKQRYIMFLEESPLMDSYPAMELFTYDSPPYRKLGGFFNWTMSYRRESDIYVPYGWIVPHNHNFQYPPLSPISWTNYMNTTDSRGSIEGFQNMKAVEDSSIGVDKVEIAWIVSHCHTTSNREGYVRNLQKHMPVDIYGRCGTKLCPDDANCFPHISKNYKFYLSFENSLCEDYVTEKFFEAMSYDVLPIVYGSALYAEIAPPNSYISVLPEFENPEHLSNYLKYLIQNETAYKAYYEWKKFFKVHNGLDKSLKNAMCQLCAKLNDDSLGPKTYADINHWWRDESQCQRRGYYRYDLTYQLLSISFLIISILFTAFVVVLVFVRVRRKRNRCKQLNLLRNC